MSPCDQSPLSAFPRSPLHPPADTPEFQVGEETRGVNLIPIKTKGTVPRPATSITSFWNHILRHPPKLGSRDILITSPRSANPYISSSHDLPPSMGRHVSSSTFRRTLSLSAVELVVVDVREVEFPFRRLLRVVVGGHHLPVDRFQ